MQLAMVAGEAGGDLLAGLLLSGLQRRWPQLQTAGIGGPKMAEHGFQAWWPHHKLAVRGYAEVLGHFREIYAIRTQLTERLMRDKPDAFIGIRQAGTILTKATWWCSGIFLGLAFVLQIMSTRTRAPTSTRLTRVN